MLHPTATVKLVRVQDRFEPSPVDTTQTILMIKANMDFEFDMNGSERIAMNSGSSRLLADGISPGWYYLDVIGPTMWVRGLPVYLVGGDTMTLDVDNDYIDVDGSPVFDVRQEKSTTFSFVPGLSMSCAGCTRAPVLKFDGRQLEYIPPWISIEAGWHTIEIFSPFDNVNLYYRTLFDNYTITEFTLYPVQMN